MIIARSLSELVAIREEIEPLLIINNSHYLLDDAVNNYITVKNIITAAGIEQIKHFLATAFIRQQPERFFSAPEVFIIRMYAVKAGNILPGKFVRN